MVAVLSSFCSVSFLPTALAEQNQTSTPLVVFVFDKSCKISCNSVRPLIRELQSQYTDRVNFVELDVSKDTIKDSETTAKSLGVSAFLSETEDWYPAVGVFSSKRKLVKQILGAKTKDKYQEAIEKAIASNK